MGKRYEPYTPESIESHSPPVTEADDTRPCDDDEEEEGYVFQVNTTVREDDADATTTNKKPPSQISSPNSGVSPRQLKARLEKLRKHSVDAGGGITSGHSCRKGGKNRSKDKCCFSRYHCVVL